MALIIFRLKAGETLRRKGGTYTPEEFNRQRQAMLQLIKDIGLERVRGARSLNGRMVLVLEGPAEGAMMMEQVLSASGAYEEVEAEVLELADDVIARRDKVRKLAASFRDPNEDEIDRMLLDE